MGDVIALRRGLLELSRFIITVPLGEEPNTATVCECGGLLAYTAGRWRHAAACIECHDTGRPCLDRRAHRACADPQPRTCAHRQCREPVSLDIECAAGREKRACCGCCWVMADLLEGRQMWPTHG